MRFVAIFLAFTFVVTGCARREGQGGGAATTDTISPAPAQPDTTGTEMTQTVNLEDGRSEAEGGALTSPNPPVTGTGTTTTAPTTDTTGTSGSAPPPPSTTR